MITKYKSNITKSNETNKPTLVNRVLKKYPNLNKAYDLIIGGFRQILSDGKKYAEIVHKIANHPSGISHLNLEELLFHRQFTRNLFKVLPIMTLGVLPLGNFIIIPLVYLYPRHLVTPHFWTEKQKSTFPQEEFQDRVKHHKPLSNLLIDCPSSKIPDLILPEWRSVTSKLKVQKYPEPAEILKLEKLFDYQGAFYLQDLSNIHLMHLAGIYGLGRLFFFTKLVTFARTNRLIDTKIEEYGGPKKLPSEIRSQICFMRGVNSMNMKEEEKILYLEKWLLVNKNSPISLLLHTPMLLGYCHLNHEISRKKT